MEWLNVALSLSALIVLEVVLGIDNLVMLSIITEKLPVHKRKKARRWGLTLSWVTRLLLLGSAVYLVHLTTPLISVLDFHFSARDLFLLFGGVFLIYKATEEIHQEVAKIEVVPITSSNIYSAALFRTVIIQVALLDIVFSLDSVLTAIGLTSSFYIMAIAITVAILIMIYASEIVSNFISNHPTIKMLALSFLMLIGTLLIADGLSFHIPRGYLYFAMAFSLAVEALNGLKRSKRPPRKAKP